MEKEDIVKFIEECTPTFTKLKDGKYEMFTIPTQHIKGDSIEELLQSGVNINQNSKGRSPLRVFLDGLNTK